MEVHWRNTQKPARFFFLDARVFAVVMFFLVHARWWTFGVMLLGMAAFWMQERRGLTFEASLRAIRCWMVGPKRPANIIRARRRWQDFG